MEQNFKYGELTSKVIAASMAVHSALGSGFQEVIYQRALEIELNSKGVPAIREFNMPIYYKGIEIGLRRVDFYVDNKVSVELKAVAKLENVHLAQALNYLEAYNIEVGLLINFGSKSMEVKRLVNRKYSANNVNPSKPV
jgi:GxxExxY protein